MAKAEQPCTVQNVHHIGIAVRDVKAALAFYQDVFALAASPIKESAELGLRACFVDVSGVHLELLEPLRADTAIGKFIASRGEGLHHVCFRVDNIREKLDIVKAKGVPLVDQKPRPGLSGTIAFLHPSAARGVLIELSQPYE